MRTPAACLLALACVSSPAERPAPAARAAPSRPVRGPDATAPAPAEDSACSTDSDCATTRVPEGGCCPTLCEPRVVTAKRAAELESSIASCNHGRECAFPSCAPPRTETVPVCEGGHCTGKRQPMQ